MIVTHRPELASGRACPYCGRLMGRRVGDRGSRIPADTATKDHVFPRALGGRLVLVVCLACNHEKGAMPPLEWLLYLAQIGRRDRAEMALRAFHKMGRVLPPGLLLRDVIDGVVLTPPEVDNRVQHLPIPAHEP